VYLGRFLLGEMHLWRAVERAFREEAKFVEITFLLRLKKFTMRFQRARLSIIVCGSKMSPFPLQDQWSETGGRAMLTLVNP